MRGLASSSLPELPITGVAQFRPTRLEQPGLDLNQKRSWSEGTPLAHFRRILDPDNRWDRILRARLSGSTTGNA